MGKREKADFLRKKAAAGVRRRITPADGRLIIGQESINFQSDLRIVGQKAVGRSHEKCIAKITCKDHLDRS